MTTIYPIGYFGNDRPISSIQETWQSPELKLVLLNISDDPRTGRLTTEVINLDRAEPSPSLFVPPQGYQMKDQQP